MRRRRPRFGQSLAILLYLGTASILAQTAQVGTLNGLAKDETGAALPGVSLQATSQERGFSRNTTSDASGRFLFAGIASGRYRVTASLSGFQAVTLTDNLVEIEKTTSLAITRRLATQAAEVTVTGEVPIVDKTLLADNTRVREKEFQKLPVGRSYQALMAAAPGVIGTGNANSHGA